MLDDPTTLIAVISSLVATLSAGATAIITALWRASQKAQANALKTLGAERDAARNECARLNGRLDTVHEKRLEQMTGVIREMIEHVQASRQASERISATLDQMIRLVERRA